MSRLIDEFWEYRLGELELYHYLKHLRLNNLTLLYEAGEYSPTIKDTVGTERLSVMEKLLEL